MQEKLQNYMSRLVVLRDFTLEDQTNILSMPGLARIARYQPDQTILVEGSPNNNEVYWIIRGRVSVIKGQSLIANIYEPGVCFGEMSVLDNQPRSASLESIEDTVCLVLDMSVIKNLENEAERDYYWSRFVTGFAQIVLHRLRETTDQLHQLQKELKARDRTLNELRSR